ncbi:MAG TPA: hypothetical protein VJ508_10455 [Saprospiraceae bacterium]|nr:hypothetical protein [Saprospiraceae bacterium]
MKKYALLLLTAVTLLALPFCTTSKGAAGKKKKAHVMVYDQDIAPILQVHCTPCHFPPGGQKKPLNTYEALRDNIDAVLFRVQLPQTDPKFMPFKMKKEPLSDSLIQVIKLWRDAGMLQTATK